MLVRSQQAPPINGLGDGSRRILARFLSRGVQLPHGPPKQWAPMYQEGEMHLQCVCGRFDSDGVHHITVIQSADAGTGRLARMRVWCLRVCGFESHSADQRLIGCKL